jgi:hypothetical protein
MADRTLAGGLALKGDWALGEDNWKVDFDLNLLKLSVLVGKVVKSRVSATPGAPTAGDCYIFKADHPTQPNKVAAYDNAAWTYLDAPEGYKLWSVADAAEYQFTAAGGWLAVAGPRTDEDIQDMIASFLQAGTNVTLTYNDAGNHLTIDATGGGGAVTPWDFAPPTAASFTLLSGDATNLALTDDTDVGLLVSYGAPTTGANVIFRTGYRTLTDKTLDWTMVARIRRLHENRNYRGEGLFLMDSVGGKVMAFELRNDQGICVLEYSNLTGTFVSTLYAQQYHAGEDFQWQRIRHTGGNYLFDVSPNGKQWMQVATIGDNAFLTNRANRVGISMIALNAGGPNPVCSVPYFSLTGAGV